MPFLIGIKERRLVFCRSNLSVSTCFLLYFFSNRFVRSKLLVDAGADPAVSSLSFEQAYAKFHLGVLVLNRAVQMPFFAPTKDSNILRNLLILNGESFHLLQLLCRLSTDTERFKRFSQPVQDALLTQLAFVAEKHATSRFYQPDEIAEFITVVLSSSDPSLIDCCLSTVTNVICTYGLHI